MQLLIENDFDLNDFDNAPYFVAQGDNMLFRQIRLLTGNAGDTNWYVVFVSCPRNAKEDALRKLIIGGFSINGVRFVMSERSASMTRNSILSFVDERYAATLDEIVSMGNPVEKAVLSKYYAYRGLMLSSCHCLEGWRPKIVVVADLYRTIKDQHIKYIHDTETEFVDKNGATRKWRQKDISETVTDIEINAFDGCGIHHPSITNEVMRLLYGENIRGKDRPTSMLLRAPYIKGVTHEMDYTSFFCENGVEFITDVWGVQHNVEEPMIIISESMYKGLKYFKVDGTYSDWDRYWRLFDKYNHCIGVAKWNYSVMSEPRFTRTSYQILQDLKLPYEEFAGIASESIKWAEKIASGDPLYTYCFMGLLADNCRPRDDFARAVLKNPTMLNEPGVRREVLHSAEKYIDGIKCGKLWVRGAFKFLAPDLIMFMEHIGGLPVVGCLEDGEFYGHDCEGIIRGERVIERNPHICHSEHTVLRGVSNFTTDRYLGHLDNVCMINCYGIVPQKLNGADFDGDLVFVIDNDIIKSGVDREAFTVMDIDDKVTVESEDNTQENKFKVTMRSMKNMIGEYSNYATAYHNKMPKTAEQKAKYEKYVDIISVLTGKSIDYAKTGVLYPMPRFITKYGRPLPSFMKYASPYYARQKLSNAPSCLNKLCKEVERWHKLARWKKLDKNFPYQIMIDEDLRVSEDQYAQMLGVFKKFSRMSTMLRGQSGKKYDVSVHGGNTESSRYIARDIDGRAEVQWSSFYADIRRECVEICGDIKTVANAAVKICYEEKPSASKNFIWKIASDGIVQNIKQVPICLPMRCENGDEYYLGKKYNWEVYIDR